MLVQPAHILENFSGKEEHRAIIHIVPQPARMVVEKMDISSGTRMMVHQMNISPAFLIRVPELHVSFLAGSIHQAVIRIDHPCTGIPFTRHNKCFKCAEPERYLFIVHDNTIITCRLFQGTIDSLRPVLIRSGNQPYPLIFNGGGNKKCLLWAAGEEDFYCGWVFDALPEQGR